MMPYVYVTAVCNKASQSPHPWDTWRGVCSVSGTEAGACSRGWLWGHAGLSVGLFSAINKLWTFTCLRLNFLACKMGSSDLSHRTIEAISFAT